MPSCMELYFVRSILRNLLEATPKLHLRHDCARHIDPNMDKFHPQTIQQNEYWEVPRDGRKFKFCLPARKILCLPPTRLGIAYSDKCRSYIRVEFCSQECMAKRGFYLVAQQCSNRRWSQSPRWPYIEYFDLASRTVLSCHWFRYWKCLRNVEESLSFQSFRPPTPRSLYLAILAASWWFPQLFRCQRTRDFEFEDNCCSYDENMMKGKCFWNCTNTDSAFNMMFAQSHANNCFMQSRGEIKRGCYLITYLYSWLMKNVPLILQPFGFE